ncbi:hypothetical protein PoB_005099000 [Plakobranchus ocellatus]|uniref:Uncharacterized protein n=1 Tax=Plakobranchus ocellatus TaxID=259542 RepID=A0AAV4BYU1_9GAST|nr:hypothetical protein PoB_005099000 [Plakobranchus ocellatus]
MPPNFRFTNYVNEDDSDTSEWASSAMSLNDAINFGTLLYPCSRCLDAPQRKWRDSTVLALRASHRGCCGFMVVEKRRLRLQVAPELASVPRLAKDLQDSLGLSVGPHWRRRDLSWLT